MPVSRFHLTVVAVLCSIPSLELRGMQSCPPASEAVVTHLRSLMSGVRGQLYPTILQALDSAWTTDTTFAPGKPLAEWRLGRMARHGEGFREIRVCGEGDSTVVGEFQNALTRMVDRVRLRHDRSSARITRVVVDRAIDVSDPWIPARTDAERFRRLDEYLDRLARRDAFSGTIVVARAGVPIFTRSRGFSVRDQSIPNSEATQFNLASMSKMMTAVLALQLVEQKRLALDDFVAPLTPGSKGGLDYGKVQVKHLLSHSSGIVNSIERLNFIPGTRHQYSNYNYTLLGEVIATVMKMRFEDALAVRILMPAGMAATRRYEAKELSPDIAHGYTLEYLGSPAAAPRDSLRLVPNHFLHVYPGGSMGAYWSSAADVLRFVTALMQGKLLSPSTFALMKSPKPELGSPIYGYGTMLGRAPGAWGHAGDLPGADADLEVHGDLVFIVLANYDNVNEPVMQMVRRLFASSIAPN